MTRLPGLFGSIVVIALLGAMREAAAQPATRGKEVFGRQCAVCHGVDARGGAHGGADLLQSSIVLDDEGRGVGLAKFLVVGRPAKGMPAFKLPRQQVADIAAFLHARMAAASGSRVNVDVLVGDPKAGEAYFNGAGGCTRCHAVAGDLAHIAKKYDAVNLQGRMIVPRGRGGYPGSENTGDRPLRATVTLASGEVVSGDVLYVSDFYLTLKDADGTRHTFRREGDQPKVQIVDPLHAHLALLRTISDESMHDLTAFLATLK